MSFKNKVYIIDAKRTAIGKFLGSLYEADPVEVCVQTIKGLNDFNKFANDIEGAIIGNVYSSGLGQAVARKIAISAGCKIDSFAYSLNEVCGSGMQAIINACLEIQNGKNLVLAGGFELMSNVPYATSSYIRLGKKFGDFNLVDLMTRDGLIDSWSGVHMGITAENIAKEYGITRDEQDDYAFLAQQRAIAAIDNGAFDKEIVELHLKDYKGREYSFVKDEFPNRESTRKKLSQLPPVFDKTSGTVTAGNTSGINDGASFMLLASEDYCIQHGIQPLAEILAYSVVGCDPQLMGLGPYYAIKDLLSKEDKALQEVDYLEINEAFAAQVLGCYKLLSKEYAILEADLIKKTNILGSGLGLGHPLGCTGARITTTLAHILQDRNADYGVASLCIGGGMGVALLLKRT